MKAVCTAVLGVVLVAFAGTAKAQDDNAKKLIGVWVVDKASGDLPAGSTVEFTKEGKIIAVIKADGKEIKFDGMYKVEKDKINVELKIESETIKETVTIKKLTDDALELEDKDKKVDVFKKKK